MVRHSPLFVGRQPAFFSASGIGFSDSSADSFVRKVEFGSLRNDRFLWATRVINSRFNQTKSTWKYLIRYLEDVSGIQARHSFFISIRIQYHVIPSVWVEDFQNSTTKVDDQEFQKWGTWKSGNLGAWGSFSPILLEGFWEGNVPQKCFTTRRESLFRSCCYNLWEVPTCFCAVKETCCWFWFFGNLN